MKREIPIFGGPLAGKSTFLVAAARGANVDVRAVRRTLVAEGPFNGAPLRLLEATFQFEDDEFVLWCMAGGSLPEWAGQFVSSPVAAIFVADAQAAVHDRNFEYWEAARRFVPLERWSVVITKCDLAGEAEQKACLPAELAERPRLLASGQSGSAWPERAWMFLKEEAFRKMTP
jgi:hypothetical protein